MHLDSRVRLGEVLCVTEAYKGRRVYRACLVNAGIALDLEGRCVRVLAQRRFADKFDCVRFQATGLRPGRLIDGWLELGCLKSPEEYANCTVNGVSLDQIVSDMPGDVWVDVAYFWKDLGF